MNTTRIIAKHKITMRRNTTPQQGKGTKDHNN
jgi:hypothetical protein